MKSTFNHLNFEYMFERRRYGATGTMRFYTWLLYRKIGTLEWQTYGDPWPKPRLNKRELSEALDNITFRVLNVGDCVRVERGSEGTIISKPENGILCFEFELGKFDIPASAIVAVL